jgi:hypothetical protein
MAARSKPTRRPLDRGTAGYVPSERVARAAARVIVAANEKLGVESSTKVERLAERR